MAGEKREANREGGDGGRRLEFLRPKDGDDEVDEKGGSDEGEDEGFHGSQDGGLMELFAGGGVGGAEGEEGDGGHDPENVLRGHGPSMPREALRG